MNHSPLLAWSGTSKPLQKGTFSGGKKLTLKAILSAAKSPLFQLLIKAYLHQIIRSHDTLQNNFQHPIQPSTLHTLETIVMIIELSFFFQVKDHRIELKIGNDHLIISPITQLDTRKISLSTSIIYSPDNLKRLAHGNTHHFCHL